MVRAPLAAQHGQREGAEAAAAAETMSRCRGRRDIDRPTFEVLGPLILRTLVLMPFYIGPDFT